MRIGKEEGEKFWTAKRLRQGCSLSPHIIQHNVDLEEELKKGKKLESISTWIILFKGMEVRRHI